MHDVPSSTAKRAPVNRSSGPAAKRRERRLALLALGVLAGALVIAWFDGGEEPIHAIAQSVAPPGPGAL
jgi:hypothetical protein